MEELSMKLCWHYRYSSCAQVAFEAACVFCSCDMVNLQIRQIISDGNKNEKIRQKRMLKNGIIKGHKVPL